MVMQNRKMYQVAKIFPEEVIVWRFVEIFTQINYQRDNLAYPIEIQLWCGDDFKFNVWSHRYIYKYDTAEIGRMMYQSYRAGMIQNEEEFVEQLKKLRGEQNGR